MSLLTGVNLNLFISLDALLDLKNVSRAARRLGVSQPAMSQSLRQLRELFDDPLLVKEEGGGFGLTPRAMALRGDVGQGLLSLSRALQGGGGFDPAKSERRFVITTTDFTALHLAPRLLSKLAEDAPGVSIDFRSVQLEEVLTGLSSGEFDAAIGPSGGTLPNYIRTRKLFTEGFAAMVREGHPRIQSRLTLKAYTSVPHALISPTGKGDSVVDTALAKKGLTRRVVLRLPYFTAAPLVVARTDLILTAPRSVVHDLARFLPVRVFPPPLPLGTFDMGIAWHERMHADEGHRWLRKRVAQVLAS